MLNFMMKEYLSIPIESINLGRSWEQAINESQVGNLSSIYNTQNLSTDFT